MQLEVPTVSVEVKKYIFYVKYIVKSVQPEKLQDSNVQGKFYHIVIFKWFISKVHGFLEQMCGCYITLLTLFCMHKLLTVLRIMLFFLTYGIFPSSNIFHLKYYLFKRF